MLNIYLCVPIEERYETIVKIMDWDLYVEENKRHFPNNPNEIKKFGMYFDKIEVIKTESENIEDVFLELCNKLGMENDEDKEWVLENYIIIPLYDWECENGINKMK